MGIEKQSSARGNYAGSDFLQMFDWNAKSRKKLFTTKSDVPEQQSKQKKRCDGNLPMTRLQILDEDENAAGSSSIKECSDHSRASSVIDYDACGTRGPGVVARLMGLDALPKSSLYDPYSPTLISESHSLHDASYPGITHDYCLGHIVSGQDAPVGNDTGPKYEKVTHRPIEKFQAEILPPKSARSIPITHHKLLSPIKSLKSGPWKDAARIMEVAARIIEPGGPHGSGKTKVRMVGSSSVPLKVRDLKEKVQKQSKQFLEGGSRRKTESHHVQSFRGHSSNEALSEAACDSDESSVGAEVKGKSISLALLAKANVQRRESLRLNSSRSLKEPCGIISDEVFKDQLTTQKSLVEKESKQIESSVLRQNNQKQNSIIDGGKLSSKCSSKGAKLHSGESASARQPNVGKLARTSKVISRNSGSAIRDDNTKASSSSTGRITHKKRSTGGKPFHSIQKDRNGKATAPSIADTDGHRSLEQHDDGKAGMEIVSFTFRSPMTRSVPDSGRCAAESGGKILALDSQSITSPSTSDVSCASKSSFAGYNVKGCDALSILLEQKLKELSLKVEFSQQKSEAESLDGELGQRSTTSSTVEQQNTVEDSLLDDNQVLEDFSISNSKISRETKLLDCRLPSPVSVLEHFSFGNSCNSSDTADSNSPEGSKQCSSIQMLDSCTFKTSVSIEVDGELSDSACSTFAGAIAKVEDSTAMASIKNKWESKYVKEILHNIEPMFMDYALGRSDEIISPPHLFNQVGNRKLCSDNSVAIARTNYQRLMFDCVRECLDTRCMHYACGGFKLWTKGVSMARQKDRLAEEVYREISDWSGVGDSMIDELVDQDMSSRRGKWLNFDRETFELGKQIESRLMKSLVNEAVADMLRL